MSLRLSRRSWLISGLAVVVLVTALVIAVSGDDPRAVVPVASPSPVATTPLVTQPKQTPDRTGPPSRNGFPDAGSTGVPAGTVLAPYSGPCTITTAATVIDARTVSCDLVVQAAGVVISRSRTLAISSDFKGASVIVSDSDVDGTVAELPAVGGSDITLTRVDVRGSRVSVQCGSNCSISDSWLHGQYLPPTADWHVNGYLSNGGSHVLLLHNTLACDVHVNSAGGGCTGPAASFGDFAPITDVVYDNNLFVASPGAWCLYAGNDPGKPFGNNPTGIVVENNVFERGPKGKCAVFGAATSFAADGAGNRWKNNIWDDGTPVSP